MQYVDFLDSQTTARRQFYIQGNLNVDCLYGHLDASKEL